MITYLEVNFTKDQHNSQVKCSTLSLLGDNEYFNL